MCQDANVSITRIGGGLGVKFEVGLTTPEGRVV
jgi:hypothetical protein